MNRFGPLSDKTAPMTHVVSYHGIVPMPRGLAYALYHIDKHGGHIDTFSADRTVKAIADHNREFGTSLHAQQYLFDNQFKPGFNPANPPNRSSHCYFSDGNPAYRVNGRQIQAKGKLPWYMLGLDISDHGLFETVTHFLHVSRGLGYQVVQPYPVGGERHHVVFTESPIQVLEEYNVISKGRG